MIQIVSKDHSWRNAMIPALFGDHHWRNTVIRAIFTLHQGALLEPCLGHFQWLGRRLLACYVGQSHRMCHLLRAVSHTAAPGTAVFRNGGLKYGQNLLRKTACYGYGNFKAKSDTAVLI